MRLLSADSPVTLPWTTLRLAGRYLLPLALWFSVGQALHLLIIWLGTTLAHGGMHQLRVAGALLLLTVLVLVSIGVPVLMLHGMRRGVAASRDRDGLFTVISRAALPFVIIYFAWGMVEQDASDFARADLENNADQFYTSAHPDAGLLFFGLGFGVALAIAVGCYYLRALFEMLAKRRANRSFPVLAAFFETGFNVFGIFSVTKMLDNGGDWAGRRHAWAGVTDFFSGVADAIPGWSTFWDTVGDLGSLATDAVLLPMLWLTLAGIVFGRPLFREREAARGTRFERHYEHYEQMSTLRRWSIDHVATGFRERWAPIGGALRLALHAGPIAIGLFCLCYVGIDALTELGLRGAVRLIGVRSDPTEWGPILVPLEFVRDLLCMVLQMCLLAAMFDLTVHHEERRIAGRGLNAGTPAPSPAAGPSGARPAPVPAAPRARPPVPHSSAPRPGASP